MDNTKPRITAKDFFLQVGALAALYTSVVAVLFLLFRVIDHAYPPVVSAYGYFGQSQISFQVATIIVFFPLFLILSRILEKSYIEEPTRKESTVRKALVYLTLFIAGFTMAADLVTVLYYFLNGEDITAAFILKALSIFLVIGTVFFYYLQDIRGRLKADHRQYLRVISVLFFVGAIILGFSVVGSPRSQRLIRIDTQKISDLQSIQMQVTNYYQTKRIVPSGLSELSAQDLYGANIPLDPETKQPYEYEKTSDLAFKLCATFNRSSEGQDESMARMYGDMGLKNSSNWVHGVGRQCFDRTIDPDFYPDLNNR